MSLENFVLVVWCEIRCKKYGDVFKPANVYFAMGGKYVKFEKRLLLVKGVHNITLTKLHMINLQGGFNDMINVNMGFGVCTFIYNYFEYLLI